MTKMATIALDDHAASFLAEQVASGRFATESEAMAEALRLLEERDQALVELRAEIQAGIDSGDPQEFEPENWRVAWKAERAANAGKAAPARS